MRKLSAALLAVVLTSCAHSTDQQTSPTLAALSQTYLSLRPKTALKIPSLTTSHGDLFTPDRLLGHWSIFFFGFTTCPLVCPKTLSLLSAVARDPQSGIADASTVPVFVSIDPEHDSPQRVAAYLNHFDRRILGLTGTPDEVARLTSAFGAGYQRVGSSIDHSTSLFVVDPEGRLSGILLHPRRPAQIVADLANLRRDFTK